MSFEYGYSSSFFFCCIFFLIEGRWLWGRGDQWRYFKACSRQLCVCFTAVCVRDKSVCFFQIMINSWRSEPRGQTLCPPRPELPPLTLHVPPAVPIRRPNGRRMPSLPCRLVVRAKHSIRASLKVVLSISPPEQPLPSPVSSSTGSGVASDLHLPVAQTHRGQRCLLHTLLCYILL